MNSDEEEPYHHKISQISSIDSDEDELAMSSSDDSSVEDYDAEQAEAADMAIAERTNQLMTDFRSYINDLQGEDAAANTNGDAEQQNLDAEYGEKNNTDDGPLMRSWGDQPQPSYRDDPHISYGYGDIHDDVIYSRNPHRPYSKKLKKCLLGSIFGAVLTSVVVGIVSGVHKSRVEKTLPDWEGELAQIQQEESKISSNSGKGEPQHTEQILHNPEVGEGLQNSYYADAQGLDETGGNAPTMDASSGKEETAAEIINYTIENEEKWKTVENTFHPKWFDRSTGWEGETYDEGLIFCGRQKDEVGAAMVS
jgi:hypothetical protein